MNTTHTDTHTIAGPTITAALAAPFAEDEVKWKAQVVKGNRAMPVAYVDARTIQDRLDDVLGVEGWQDSYELVPDGSVICRLKLRLSGRWITKTDVGSPSEQPDGGDRLKAAFSDALKRAAVKFGMGRYLYRLESQWCDYDSMKRQFTTRPRLPHWALPAPIVKTAAVPEVAPAATAGTPKATTKPTKGKAGTSSLPESGAELHERLRAYDADLHEKGLCPLGSLLAHITQAGIKKGYHADMGQWQGEAITFAVEEVKRYRSRVMNTQAA